MRRPEAIICDLSLDNDTACAFVNGEFLCSVTKLIRAKVSHITPAGIMICGLEESGAANNPTLRFQEWWFVPNQPDDCICPLCAARGEKDGLGYICPNCDYEWSI